MKKFFVFIFAITTIYGKAQVSLGMSQINPFTLGTGASDTVVAGSTQSYPVWVKNYGPSNFNDNLNIRTAVHDSSGYYVVDMDTLGGGNTVSINAGDSAQFMLTTTYNITTNGYKYGIDVIVVWPYCPSSGVATVADSLGFDIYILSSGNDVKEIDAEKIIKLYPNPAIDNIHVENMDNMAVEAISIYDLNGKCVLFSKQEKVLNIESLSKGTYNVVILLSNKKKYSAKIVKQ